MNLLMKLLSKLFWIVLLAAIGLVYYYRADLFPQWFQAESDSAGKQPVAAVASAGSEDSATASSEKTTMASTASTSSPGNAPTVGGTSAPEQSSAEGPAAGSRDATQGPTGSHAPASRAAEQPAANAASPVVPTPATPGVQDFAPVQAGTQDGAESDRFAPVPVPAPSSSQTGSQPFAPVPPVPAERTSTQSFAPIPSGPADTASAQSFAPVPDSPAESDASTGTRKPVIPVQPGEAAVQPEPHGTEASATAPATTSDMTGPAGEAAAVTAPPAAGETIQPAGSDEQASSAISESAPMTGQAVPGESTPAEVGTTQAPAELVTRPAATAPPSSEPPAAATANEQPPVGQATASSEQTPLPAWTREAGQSGQVPEQAGEVARPAGGEGVDPLLQARQAFWKGDYETSIRLYQDLIQREESAELLGELGNVYFRMGRWQDAARSYARAAELFARRGDRMQAMRLLSVVQRIDPELGRETAMRLGEPRT